jgi:hypothetical protein
VYTDSFIAAGKAVFHCAYTENVPEEDFPAVCAMAADLQLSTVLKDVGLGPERLGCERL